MKGMIRELVRKLPGFPVLRALRNGVYAVLRSARQKLAVASNDKGWFETEIASVRQQRDALAFELAQLKRKQGFVPPGHFYSPVPDLDDIRRDEQRLFGTVPRTVPGVDFREAEQLDLLKTFLPFYREQPFTAEAQPGLRYRFDNPAYSWSDAILLHCMIRHLRPRRIIEVGSGFSSCMILDTSELHFNGGIDVTFIEPYPELLKSLLKPADEARVQIIPTRLQDVAPETFDALEANDILFIDSTHVSKIGSDVNRLVLDLLPRLKPGVHVHFHDIFFPFEYPHEWVFEGRAWNEAYLLRAFLAFNAGFSMVLMNTYMERFHEQFFHEHMPLCMKNTGGSIWIRRN